MKTSDGGKGDAPRKQQDQKAYEEGWERIFRRSTKDEDKPEGRQRPKEKLIEQEPLKEDDND